MKAFTVNLGADTEVIHDFVLLTRHLSAPDGAGHLPSEAVAFPHIQIGVDALGQPLATVAVSSRLQRQAVDDRITSASISAPSQGAPRLVEECPADGDAALVLLLLSPYEMIDHALPAKDVTVVAEVSAANVQSRRPVLRYGYLLIMQPASHITVTPRWAATGGLERRITFSAGGIDLIARDIDSSDAVEMACIAA